MRMTPRVIVKKLIRRWSISSSARWCDRHALLMISWFTTMSQKNVSDNGSDWCSDTTRRRIKKLLQYFTLANGVKQGGVLSPTLFTRYIDNLLIKLEESAYGCHIRHIFMGELSYADDITLLRGLNKILHTCSIYTDNFDITFNSKKNCM